MKERIYKYTRASINEDGDIVQDTFRETLEELEEKYWQNWADMRTMMRMDVNKKDFISDLKMILKLEEV